MNDKRKWYVLCLDDGKANYTFATHRWFATREDAQRYAQTVASERRAIVADSIKPVGYEQHE